jgi:hypothetical protein
MPVAREQAAQDVCEGGEARGGVGGGHVRINNIWWVGWANGDAAGRAVRHDAAESGG